MDFPAAQQHLATLTRRYPFLRRLSAITIGLTLLWLYIIHWGERSTFTSHISDCNWDSWERWPKGATPHHLVFVADPQLVDPHTYPGRPWPLSTATERYTDLYMTRNFRLINSMLDPDSVVFLGDLLDGGREWSTGTAKPLTQEQRDWLDAMGKPKDEDGNPLPRPGVDENTEEAKLAKRSRASWWAAMQRPHHGMINKKDHFLDKSGHDLKEFVPGENGRWTSWGAAQWDSEYSRFDKIFFAEDQIYPDSTRRFLPAYDVEPDSVAVANGGKDITRQEYATLGGKQRRIFTNLPGNHDLGFGELVQLAVRDRYQGHFGLGNEVYVIGNHTFVSLDTPSLSAKSQFKAEGETTPQRVDELDHIWKQPQEFLSGLQMASRRTVTKALREYYPEAHAAQGWTHAVQENPASKNKPADGYTPPKAHLPVVLLTHIPLYRGHNVDCGPQRERGKSIAIARGYQYQNVLTQSLTGEIINKVSQAGNIAHVFSGDDHDYCDFTHRFNIAKTNDPTKAQVLTTLQSIKEITVKSFSWAMGVRKPGFLLASLWNPVDTEGNTINPTAQPTIQTHLCLLPDQLGIFIDYLMLLIFTLGALLTRALWIGLKRVNPYDELQDTTQEAVDLPRFRLDTNGSANGYSTPKNNGNNEAKGRARGSSISTSANHTHSSSTTSNSAMLSVQRSYNARTRSVSPAGYGPPEPGFGGLGEKNGYYVSDSESDEETYFGEGPDSQGKKKHRLRSKGKARRVFDEFVFGMAVVGLPAGLYYIWLVRHG